MTARIALVLSAVSLLVAGAGIGAAASGLLAPNTVGSQQIRDGSIRLADLSPAAARWLKGQKGDVGAPGPPGAEGPQGRAGPAGGLDLATGFRITTLETQVASVGKVADALCPKYGLTTRYAQVDLFGRPTGSVVSCPFR